MKINTYGISQVTNVYENNKTKNVKPGEKVQNDKIEISSLGKSLSMYSSSVRGFASDKKIEDIRTEITNGTYNRDSKLVAGKIVDIIKGREV